MTNSLRVHANTAGDQLTPAPTRIQTIIVGVQGGTGSTLQLYDGEDTSAREVVNIDMKNASVGPMSVGLEFDNGVFVVLGGGTAPDLVFVTV